MFHCATFCIKILKPNFIQNHRLRAHWGHAFLLSPRFFSDQVLVFRFGRRLKLWRKLTPGSLLTFWHNLFLAQSSLGKSLIILHMYLLQSWVHLLGMVCWNLTGKNSETTCWTITCSHLMIFSFWFKKNKSSFSFMVNCSNQELCF